MKTNIRVEIELTRVPTDEDDIFTTETQVFEEDEITELRFINFLKQVDQALGRTKIIDTGY